MRVESTNLNYDIIIGKTLGHYKDRDITFLNEIVNNRHKNVHATEDSRMWYNSNMKNIDDFKKEFAGLLNILLFLDSITWDSYNKKILPLPPDPIS